MEIQGDTYQVYYQRDTATLTFKGVLRLIGPSEYGSLVELLNRVVNAAPKVITLDLRELDFVNSSSINLLVVYVIKIRDQGRSKLVVLGKMDIPAQSRLLQNFQRLMPTLQVEWV